MLPEVVLPGLAGNDPATKTNGSDQMPCQKVNDTPPTPAASDDRKAAEVCAGLPLANDPAAASVVPGATTRSCRTACGSPWPAKGASAAPAAAATSVVSAAAASTTQCAVIRRTASGPPTLVTRPQFRILQTTANRTRKESMPVPLIGRAQVEGCLPPRRQPASAAGRRSRAGTVRSGGAPIVSNGAAERFTQAVRIPAALAPTQSNALLVTSLSCPTGPDSRPPSCRYTNGDGLNARTSSTLIRWPKKPPRPLLPRQFPIMAGVPLESTASSYPRPASVRSAGTASGNGCRWSYSSTSRLACPSGRRAPTAARAKSSARAVPQRKSSYRPIAVSRNEYSSCLARQSPAAARPSESPRTWPSSPAMAIGSTSVPYRSNASTSRLLTAPP